MHRTNGSRENGMTRNAFLRLAAGSAVGAAAAAVTPAWAADAPIRTRRIPKSGEAIPVVGLGTALSFGRAPDDAAFAARKTAIEALLAGGGSVIDTSPTYANAEAIVGCALAELGMRDRAFIATKISITGESAGIQQHQGSLEDLQTGSVELLQVHNLRDLETHLKTIRRLKDEGRVRYVGVTHFRPSAYDRLAEVLRAEPLDFVQLGYSIAMRDAERELLPLARDRGVAVLVNVPFGRGRLFGRVNGKSVPDWARNEFQADSWAQFFLKYILADEAITTVIPGAILVEHVRDNLGAGYGPLPSPAHRRKMVQTIADL